MRRIFGLFFTANLLDFVSTLAFLSTGTAIEGHPIWQIIGIDTPVGAILKAIVLPSAIVLGLVLLEKRLRIKIPTTGIAMATGFLLAISFVNFQVAYQLSSNSSFFLILSLVLPFAIASS